MALLRQDTSITTTGFRCCTRIRAGGDDLQLAQNLMNPESRVDGVRTFITDYGLGFFGDDEDLSMQTLRVCR